MAFLHAHSEGEGVVRVLEEVFLHGLLDTLKLVPFLFLTYLLMEFIEHRSAEKTRRLVQRAGTLGPVIGGALGAVPQCGFSAAAANLYAGRVITVGTLVAVFLSTSDEMLPILITGDIPVTTVLFILLYKALVGILVGFALDFALRLLNRGGEEINIDAICDEDNCHCERGIFLSALHHTLTISAFVLLVTFCINGLVLAVGEESLGNAVGALPVLSHIVAAVVGLIPNCAASVVLSTLCAEGIISSGVMMAGLFSNAGVGLLVLFRVNKKLRENLLVVALLIIVGVVFGLLGDLIFPAAMF